MMCLSDTHLSRSCSAQADVQCREGCRERHHQLLHAVELPPAPAVEPLPELPEVPAVPMPVSAETTPDDPMPAKMQVHGGVASLAAMGKSWPVLLPAQRLVAANGASFMVMFDSGSQITLVTRECAEFLNAKAVGISCVEVVGIGCGKTNPDQIFEVPVYDTHGNLTEFLAHGVPELSVAISPYDKQIFHEAFPYISLQKMSQPTGKIEILIGLDNAHLMPKEVGRMGRLLLYKTQFGSGPPFVVAGALVGDGAEAMALATKVGNFVPVDFLSVEAMGLDPPRSCRACKACKECQFRTTLLTATENAKYEAILDNLKYDAAKKKWSTSYPFIVSPTILIDNYGQAMACMRSQEVRLKKQGRIDDFNAAFGDIVKRGVFRELTVAENIDWEGPVNYVSIVAPYKSGPHATTPLRLCMNSSMKQPPPVSKSLNDILMKGPPALADLYSVTLGLREHRFALTKDLSKFYNCVDADEIAQHTRRVVWWDGNEKAEPKINVTTTVNFGDKPAGCIAIAAVRETAEMFGRDSEAAWFLKNRTYVDDCVAGSNSLPGLFQKNWKKLLPWVDLNSKKLMLPGIR